MHVLYIHQYFSTRAGAGSTRSYEFARRWVRSGHRVTLITGCSVRSDVQASARLTPQEIEGIEVLAIDTRYSNHMPFLRRILAFFDFMSRSTWIGLQRVGAVDVVLATSTPLTVGITGYIISRWKRIPFVFDVRDLWPEAPIQMGALRNPVAVALARWLERTLYRVATHIVTLSPGMSQALEQMGIPRGKLSMIPNCSDLDVFVPGPADAELAHTHGTEGQFVVLYAGAMGPANGLDVVVEAARALQEGGHKGLRFLLVGDGRERARLRALAEGYGLANMTFLPLMPKLELARLMTLSDLCLTIFAPVPVLETCSPNKLFDALAAGRPVLINYSGWMRDLLEGNGAGVAIASNEPGAVAEAILVLRADPERVRAMGRHARALAERSFGRDAMARQYEDLLQSIITRAAKN